MDKYLIFDFDGVIGDTQDASARATMKTNGLSYDEARKANLCYSSEKPTHTRDHSLSDAEMHDIYEWTVQFGTYMKESNFELFTDFVHEIEKLPTKYKAIVSSGSQLYVIPALAKTNINPTHILAYESHHSKEEKIESICADWGCDTKEVYYFTDTLADVYELKNLIAPEKLIGVAWGYCGKDLLLNELKQDYILARPHDIHHILE